MKPTSLSWAREGACLIALLVAFLAGPVVARAANPTFIVRYRSAANVYVDAGRAQGLSIGDRLAVMVGTEAVAELEVIFLADQSTSCRVVSERRPVRAGDTATLLSRGESPTSTASTETPATPAATPSPTAPALTTGTSHKPAAPWARVRGGFSAGLYKVWDTSGTGFDFEQRTGRVDLSLYDLGGQPLSFNARFRSRQDVRALGLSSLARRSERQDRLYELSLRYEPPSDTVTFEVGRLSSSRFVGIGYLDGGLARFRLDSPLQVGAFFGQRADVEGFGPAGSGQKYGGFLRLSPRNPYSASYDVVVALVREFGQADISREYVGVESRFGSGAVTFFERAEVDLNRSWRKVLADQTYQLSNLSVSTNLRFSPSASAVLSYDNRRNYRDYLTRDVPEQIFDDLLHQGYRASLYFGSGYGLNVTAGFGLRVKEQDRANAYSYNAGIRHGNLFAKDVSLGVDVSAFQNDLTNGYLVSAQTGKRFKAGHQIDFGYGRSLYQVTSVGQQRRTEYLRFSGRGSLGRHVYLFTDFEYDRGDDLRGPRGFFEVGYQF